MDLGELFGRVRLETQGQPAHHALWRTDDEQFVVDGLFAGRIAKEVADGHEHLPLRAAEIEKRQRLAYLDVEAAIHAGVQQRVATREAVADAIEHEKARRGLGEV